MGASWRTVRVFISSTFRDMHAERDHLVKAVFPRLRQWCERRRLHLVDVDLRWGVTRQEADEGKAIEVCLREIDGSRPFFLALLGERYGWVPESLPPEERYRFRGLQASTHLSITHLEVLHAALAPVPSLDGRPPEACGEAFFYFRDPACVPPPASLTGLSDVQRAEYEATFFEPHAQRRAMLADLKAVVRQRFGPAGRVYDYAGTWDATAENPEDPDLRGRLVGLDVLGRRVEADLRRGIEARFPEHFADETAGPPDPQAEERALHEAFAATHARAYVSRPAVEAALDAYADGDERRPLVLSGPPGCGKSATLAQWAAARSARAEGRTDGEIVLARFVPAGVASQRTSPLLRNLCDELSERADLRYHDGRRPDVLDDDASLQTISWPHVLEMAGYLRRVLIVVDGIEELDVKVQGEVNAFTLTLPAGIRLVLGVRDQGGRAAAGPDARAARVDWLAECRRAGLREVAVPPLDDAERARLVRELPSVFAKSLDEAQLAALLANPATRNPLFLAVALEELRVFGAYQRLNARIAALPGGAGDGPDDPTVALFDQVLDRLEAETRRRAAGLVRAAFAAMAASRDGLSEAELSGVCGDGDGDGDGDGELAALLRQVRPYLLRRGEVVDFGCRPFRDAVRARYLPDAAAAERAHARLADFFAAQDDFLEPEEDQRRRALAAPPTPRPVNRRKVRELVWQRLRARRADRAAAEVIELPLLEAYAEAGMVYELVEDLIAVRRTVHAAVSSPRDTADRGAPALLALVEGALRLDASFVARHPTALFQCLFNACWWHDAPVAQRHDESPAVSPPTGPALHRLAERWRHEKERRTPGFRWLRELRPSRRHLVAGTKLTLPSPPSHYGEWSVGLSPDRARVVFCDLGRLSVIDFASGRTVAECPGTCAAYSIVFSHDGSRVAVAQDTNPGYRASLHDGRTGVMLHELDTAGGGGRRITGTAFAPQGRTLAVISYGGARLWDAERGVALYTVDDERAGFGGVAFAPDGEQFAVGAIGSVRILRVADGTEVRRIAVHPRFTGGSPRGVRALDWSADGRRLLAVLSDGVRCVWDLSTGHSIWHEDGGDEKCWWARLSADGTRAFMGNLDGSIFATCLRTRTSECLRERRPERRRAELLPPDFTDAVLYGPGDVEVVTSIGGSGVRAANRPARPRGGGIEARDGVPVATSRDGHVLVSSHAGGLTQWSPRGLLPARHLPVVWPNFARWALSGDGRRLAYTAEDRRSPTGAAVHVLELATDAGGGPLCTIALPQLSAGTEGRPVAVSLSRMAFDHNGGRLAAVCADGVLRLWDARTGRELRSWPRQRRTDADRASAIVFSPDGRHLAFAYAGDPVVSLLDIDGGEALARFEVEEPDSKRPAGVSKYVPALEWTDVAISDDGCRVVAQGRWGSRAWDVASGRCLARWSPYGPPAWMVAADPSRLAWWLTGNVMGLWARAPNVDSPDDAPLLAVAVGAVGMMPLDDGRIWVGARDGDLYAVQLEGEFGGQRLDVQFPSSGT